MNEQDIREHLRIAVLTAGSQKAFAARHGISPAYINDVLQGRREPGEKILAAIGFERVVTYRRKV